MPDFYLTTTLPYVNNVPHIGFGMEILAADVIARTHQLLGDKVVFNTGTDEHGQKIWDAAHKENLDVKAYVDKYAQNFQDLISLLNIATTHFVRTTDPHHIEATQVFWTKCQKAGDIYKAKYETLYCVGCEMEKQLSDLVENHCPLHPNQELEKRQEENYFFRFSKYQQALVDIYQKNPDFVLPASKHKEITAFVAAGINDFSISRLKEKMSWGIPVPGDKDHVMYVWFDALVNYISTLGWPDQLDIYQRFWPGTQIAGKDNLRQQAAMWQAMLLSAGLPPSRQILINGFISIDGQKMSKSLGNIITPAQLVQRYGVDATRLLLIALGPVDDDIDFNLSKLDQIYNNLLVNGLGNLVSRLAKLSQLAAVGGADIGALNQGFAQQLYQLIASYQFKSVITLIDEKIREIDTQLNQTKPWTLQGEDQKECVIKLVALLLALVAGLTPLVPQAVAKIQDHFAQAKIVAINPLFTRINQEA